MARALPSIEEYPLPRDVAPGAGWSAQMLDMAAHIGAYETLLLSAEHGGEVVYVPADASRSPFAELLGPDKARALSFAYGREKVTIPTARYALARARRAGVIAAARAGRLTVAEAARMMRVRRDYASRLINHTDEGIEAAPIATVAARRDPRQMDMFA